MVVVVAALAVVVGSSKAHGSTLQLVVVAVVLNQCVAGT